MKTSYLSSILICLSLLSATVSAQQESLVSPDGKLKFSLTVSHTPQNQGELVYEISYKDRQVVLPSRLGISGWEQDMEIESLRKSSANETWKPVYGERSEIKDQYNQHVYVIKTKKRGDRLHLIVRAYDAGIAFRYQYAGSSYLRISSEKTSFRFPENTHGWFAPFAQAAYQYLPLKDWPGEAERPLTLKLDNGIYVSLGEAEMVNYSRTKFTIPSGEENKICCKMYDAVEEIAPFATPWRVIMVAEKAKDLLQNNDIFLNLNPSCQIENTSWIKPGKVIRCVSLTTGGAKKTVDFAVKRKLEYIHFDAGWYGAETSKESDPRKSDVDPQRCSVNDLDIPEVVKYAKSKGIGVWLYVNQRALAEHLDEILPLYRTWGIAGIKFGFVHVGSFRWTTWLHNAVKQCARYNLMVDIHDEYRPTGFSRTYPNLLTQEGVRGNEEFPDGIVNTTLPFTRFLAGPADYTICYFHRKELKPGLAKSLNTRSLLNTPCHQMALSVINYSPLQFLYWYDTPEDVLEVPELEFFDKLSTVWDDTQVVNGEIGEYITIARRKGNTWFVGAITNNHARKIEVPLSFLEVDKKYELTLYTDGNEKVKSPTHVAITQKIVTNKSILKPDVLPRGGCAMIIQEK
ncbi:glycoside hydrolase family 97 protein [Parabacteroides pacaensis]|uniref:glycoside hydrolase family 97 protein n=1 Tax=Parabacteroides pacaensis TaxID=2086575 RepID=UPI000D0E83F5|nr:glycoside hydrolase family 97 protein [Parabacteroides pacaensis]